MGAFHRSALPAHEILAARGRTGFSARLPLAFERPATGYLPAFPQLHARGGKLGPGPDSRRVRASHRAEFEPLPLPKLLADVEYVNLPAMKTHIQTLATLGVKNQKGLLAMKTKKLFHKKDLHGCILALSEVIQPALTLVDGLICIEGTGPTGPPVGEVKRMDLLVAGTNMMAVDNVCTGIMGFDVHDVKHLRPVEDIEVLGEGIPEVRSPFKPPARTIRVDPFVVYSDDKVCTMCSVPFYRALSKIFNTPELYNQFAKRPDLREVSILMGPSDPPADLGPCPVCLGECSTKTARKLGIPHIAGCHPDYREIVNFFCPGTYPDIPHNP